MKFKPKLFFHTLFVLNYRLALRKDIFCQITKKGQLFFDLINS